ncbi:MAG: CAP domain-containing protein [Thermoleophilaceae bacterium]
MDFKDRTAKATVLLTLAALASFPLACGGDDGDDASAPSGDVGDALIASNERGADVAEGGGSSGGEGSAAGLSVGEPSLDVLEQIDPALPSTLAEGRGSCGSVDLVPDSGNARQIDRSIVCLLNAERGARGLRSLRTNRRLSAGARVHATDMVRRQFFAHVSPDGDSVDDRLRDARYIRRDRAFVVGENLGWGAGGSATPDAIVQAWMGSPSHRANILHPRYKEIGIATTPGSPVGEQDEASTFTTTFGAITGAQRARRSRRR